jgi:hypothetical protein
MELLESTKGITYQDSDFEYPNTYHKLYIYDKYLVGAVEYAMYINVNDYYKGYNKLLYKYLIYSNFNLLGANYIIFNNICNFTKPLYPSQYKCTSIRDGILEIFINSYNNIIYSIGISSKDYYDKFLVFNLDLYGNITNVLYDHISPVYKRLAVKYLLKNVYPKQLYTRTEIFTKIKH